jgi:CheY-like chemotaxis protein
MVERGLMKRVLIIEDSPVVLKYLLDVFYPRWSPFSVDLRVTMATSGGEAKRLVGGEYDLSVTKICGRQVDYAANSSTWPSARSGTGAGVP